MNTLREAFERQAGNAGPALPDIDELVGLGEQRLRRRRITAVAGTVAAVVVAIAVAVGATALNRSADQKPGPIHLPPKPNQTQITTQDTPRPIVYSDVRVDQPGDLEGDPIHVGDRVVDTGSGFVPMDVTDNGVVYTTGDVHDVRVWFTDGGTPEQIGSHACPAPHFAANTVVTGNAGPLAAWFDCTPAQDSELVVYDTGAGREVVREGLKGCRTEYAECYADAIIGDHVYITWPHSGGLELDIASERVSKVTSADPVDDWADYALYSGSSDSAPQAYLDEIRSYPRGLVVGDTWETGLPTTAGLTRGFQFAVEGRRLVPAVDGRLTSAFDTATGRPVDLHLPAGYQPDPAEVDDGGFGLVEWLDDDTIALENFRTGRHDQDIVTCRLSTGRCELAVPSLGRDRAYRVVQHENLGDVSFEVPGG